MASINVGKDPYPCFCGGSRTYEICETPSDYFFFKVPVPELVKKYPRYKTIVCELSRNENTNINTNIILPTHFYNISFCFEFQKYMILSYHYH